MAFSEVFEEGVPESIRTRVGELRKEIDQIYNGAMSKFSTVIPSSLSFDMSGQASPAWGGDLMPPEERAQAISFVIRFDRLRDDVRCRFGLVNGEWHITNLWELRHMLNDLRPIIQIQKDSTFYTNVNATIQKWLRRANPAEGVLMRVFEGGTQTDVTLTYATYLGENTKAIAALLSGLEYGYLYNGILQHSDLHHSKRLLQDYTSGELNYILWKHVIVLGQIHYWLTPYYRVLNVLTFPQLGSLIVK